MHPISPERFVATLAADRLYLAGFGGEPTAIIEALQKSPRPGSHARVVSVLIPGVNTIDIAATVPTGRIETYFVTLALRAAFEAKRIDYRPMHYSAIYADLLQRRDIDLAIVRVSPPRDGMVSLGMAHEFTPALIAAGVPIAAMIDPTTPYVPDGVTLPLDRLSALIDGPSPPLTLPAEPIRPALAAIARYAASLVRDGDVVQTGLGTAPNAVLSALSNHRRLRLFGGMVTDAGLALLDAGAVLSVMTGAAVTGPAWTERLGRETRVRFRPVCDTHGARAVAEVPSLVAINSALEIDLFGQVNGEMLAGRQISGHGGLADYVRGARNSPGGRSVIVVAAAGGNGKISRIVAAHPSGTPIAVTRADIDHVVTEFGVADIRDTDIDTRAARLIAIAAPAFRDGLANDWDRMRRTM